MIHDAARPLIRISLIKNIVKKIQKLDCVIPMINVNDSLRKIKNNTYEEIIRDDIKKIQTPQAFKFDKILNAHLKYKNKNFTDDSIILSKDGIKINQIEGEFVNFKITTKDDLQLANMIDGEKITKLLK